MKKENENLTKLAKAIATLRKYGLTVADETQNGGSIGITGVHDRFKNGEGTGDIPTRSPPARKA